MYVSFVSDLWLQRYSKLKLGHSFESLVLLYNSHNYPTEAGATTETNILITNVTNGDPAGNASGVS